MVNQIRSGLLSLGLYSVGRTASSDVARLLEKLRPLDCGVDLIRVGGSRDGAYLVPDDLEGIEFCFSPGVNTTSDFEDDLAERGIRSLMADYSVDGPPVTRSEFCFDKKFVGASNRGCYMTFESWKNKYLHDYADDLILQMDIEGAEYEVIFNMPDDLLNQFRIMAIEFHELDRLFDPFIFSVLSSCFEKLLQYFYVVHIHPNNGWGMVKAGNIEIPKYMEFTFFNKRRVKSVKPLMQFPHRLDVDNTAESPMPLPRCWYHPELIDSTKSR